MSGELVPVGDLTELCDEAAERTVLGMLMLAPQELLESGVNVEYFVIDAHKTIFLAIAAYPSVDTSIDEQGLISSIKQAGKLESIGGSVGVLEICSSVVVFLPKTFKQALAVLSEYKDLRLLRKLGTQMSRMVLQRTPSVEIIQMAHARLGELSAQQAGMPWRSIGECAREAIEDIDAAKKGQASRMKTGLKVMDHKFYQILEKGNLVILAARPSMGKTSLALGVALDLAEQGKSVGIVSLEMPGRRLAKRAMLLYAEHLSVAALDHGTLTGSGWTELVDSCGKFAEASVYLTDHPRMSVDLLGRKARELKRTKGLDVLMVDYLQLMELNPRAKSKNEAIEEASRELKILAMELDIPLVLLSQLNRKCEERGDRRPLMSDLRDSGCLIGETSVYVKNHKSFMEIKDIDAGSGLMVDSNDEKNGSILSIASKHFKNGVKPMLHLTLSTGHTITATPNHKFLTPGRKWMRLDGVMVGGLIGVPLNFSDEQEATLSSRQAKILGMMLGNGCALPRRSIQYTGHTKDVGLATQLLGMVSAEFAGEMRPHIKQQVFRDGTSKQSEALNAFFPSLRVPSRGYRNPFVVFLQRFGLYDKRAKQKEIPGELFAQPKSIQRDFIRYLWATDGTVHLSSETCEKKKVTLAYSSASERLIIQLQWLLQSLGILSSVKLVKSRGFETFVLSITSRYFIEKFLVDIGVAGERKGRLASQALAFISTMSPGWTKYELSEDQSIAYVPVASIVPCAAEESYDLQVDVTHNFFANGIIVHNSIEQDADVVWMIYRDEVYDKDTVDLGIAEMLMRKNRNGPIGEEKVRFLPHRTKFEDL